MEQTKCNVCDEQMDKDNIHKHLDEEILCEDNYAHITQAIQLLDPTSYDKLAATSSFNELLRYKELCLEQKHHISAMKNQLSLYENKSKSEQTQETIQSDRSILWKKNVHQEIEH